MNPLLANVWLPYHGSFIQSTLKPFVCTRLESIGDVAYDKQLRAAPGFQNPGAVPSLLTHFGLSLKERPTFFQSS
jgi:hypothetical protein